MTTSHASLNRRTPRIAVTAVLAVLAMLTAACSIGSSDTAQSDDSTGVDIGDPTGCTIIDLAVSSEKVALLQELARDFNAKKEEVGGKCVFARPANKASGGAATALVEGWDESTDGPRPTIWSPASSAWGAIVNQRLADKGQEPMTSTNPVSFMRTPLVIAMPKPMADALGYPDKPVGYADIIRLANDPQGWAAYGHPEWGPFRLGKTNPNFSTSGLSALIAQNYAAVGKTENLTSEDLANPQTVAFNEAIESAVVHYGDITMTFLNNWFRADRRGTSLTYASAVAVEEKSVIDYNLGNPDGILDSGEVARPPRTPLVAIYPSEGTLYSDNPFFILDAPWVTKAQREGAQRFTDFVQQPANQKKVLTSGFRPGNPAVALAAPVSTKNGVDPNQPQTLLQVPEPKVMTQLLDRWATQRKTARVLMVLDVSGSMGEAADDESGDTKLDLAKRAAIEALDEFKADDLVGLRIFSTQLGPAQDQTTLDLVPIGPIGANREQLRRQIDALVPVAGTPLYQVTQQSFDEMLSSYDPKVINALIVLTDGYNDDGHPDDDDAQRNTLLSSLRRGATGENGKPVKVFTIGYGRDADMATLNSISDASEAKGYNATDSSKINDVFTQVVSNF